MLDGCRRGTTPSGHRFATYSSPTSPDEVGSSESRTPASPLACLCCPPDSRNPLPYSGSTCAHLSLSALGTRACIGVVPVRSWVRRPGHSPSAASTFPLPIPLPITQHASGHSLRSWTYASQHRLDAHASRHRAERATGRREFKLMNPSELAHACRGRPFMQAVQSQERKDCEEAATGLRACTATPCSECRTVSG